MHMADMLVNDHLWLSSDDGSMWWSCWMLLHKVNMLVVITCGGQVMRMHVVNAFG